MSINFVALSEATAEYYRSGGTDANGQVPERKISAGDATPCRCCLDQVRAGETYLILAHRPFPAPQPYAEVGPIFLHEQACRRGGDGPQIPACLASPAYIVRGYGADDRIIYGSGGVVATAAIPERARALLADPATAYVHVRSASNNCFQCRIERS